MKGLAASLPFYSILRADAIVDAPLGVEARGTEMRSERPPEDLDAAGVVFHKPVDDFYLLMIGFMIAILPARVLHPATAKQPRSSPPPCVR